MTIGCENRIFRSLAEPSDDFFSKGVKSKRVVLGGIAYIVSRSIRESAQSWRELLVEALRVCLSGCGGRGIGRIGRRVPTPQIKPATVLWRVMPFESLDQPPGFGGRKEFVSSGSALLRRKDNRSDPRQSQHPQQGRHLMARPAVGAASIRRAKGEPTLRRRHHSYRNWSLS
jgi:hypothetical protein